MKVSECMTREVEIASPEMTLREAARRMADCDVGALPVGDGARLVGMLTDRDIAIRGVAQGRGPDATVGEAMSAELCWCYEDEDVDDALQQLAEEQIRRLPVISRDDRLVGIVSIGDLTGGAQPQQTGRTLSAISRHGGQHSQSLQ
jgi:CBS domain-containing protein